MFPLLLILCLTPVRQSPSNQETAGVEAAMEFLAGYVQECPAPTSLSSVAGNDAGKLVVALSVAGILLETYPERDDWQAAREAVRSKLGSFLAAKGALTGEAFGGWIYPFLSFYVLEQSLQTEERANSLPWLIEQIEDNQNREGGWGHSGSAPLQFYPSTLIATTNLALFALGLADHSGYEVDQETVADGLALMKKVQGKGGAMPYGGPFYQKGHEAGRTSATLLAWASQGLHQTSAFRKAADYCWRNARFIPKGHASPALHVLLGSWSFHHLGPNAAQRYRQQVLDRVLAAQNPDGSFEDMESSPDSFLAIGPQSAAINRAYITAMYTGSLLAPRVKILQSLPQFEPWQAPEETEGLPFAAEEVLWEVPALGKISQLLICEGDLVELNRQGGLRFRNPDSGEILASLEGEPAPDGLEIQCRAWTFQDRLFVFQSHHLPETKALPFHNKKSADEKQYAAKHWIRTYRQRALNWSLPLSARIIALDFGEGKLELWLGNGSLLTVDSEQGEILNRRQAPTSFVNSALVATGISESILVREADLLQLDSGGFTVWKMRTVGGRGLTPPAWTKIQKYPNGLLAGTSHGQLQMRDFSHGGLLWQRSLGGSITTILKHGEAAPDSDSLAFATTSDGRLLGVERTSGELRWTQFFSQGNECNLPTGARFNRNEIWLHHQEQDSLWVYRATDGKPQARYRLPAGGLWCLDQNRVFQRSSQGLLALRRP
ncbi:MAG: hypothetical protein DWQ01_05010 [Planctomycetota bacterium]|nr:MAG: hypothetical protein DWQ01_05010 [Planctomycetota bacterium]